MLLRCLVVGEEDAHHDGIHLCRSLLSLGGGVGLADESIVVGLEDLLCLCQRGLVCRWVVGNGLLQLEEGHGELLVSRHGLLHVLDRLLQGYQCVVESLVVTVQGSVHGQFHGILLGLSAVGFQESFNDNLGIGNHLAQCLGVLGPERQPCAAHPCHGVVAHAQVVLEANLHLAVGHQSVGVGLVSPGLEVSGRARGAVGAVALAHVVGVVRCHGFLRQIVQDARYASLIIINVSEGLGCLRMLKAELAHACRPVESVVGELVESVLQARQFLIDVEHHVPSLQDGLPVGGEGDSRRGRPSALLREVGVAEHGGAVVSVAHGVGHGVVQQLGQVGLFGGQLSLVERSVVQDVQARAVAVEARLLLVVEIAHEQFQFVAAALLRLQPVQRLAEGCVIVVVGCDALLQGRVGVRVFGQGRFQCGGRGGRLQGMAGGGVAVIDSVLIVEVAPHLGLFLVVDGRGEHFRGQIAVSLVAVAVVEQAPVVPDGPVAVVGLRLAQAEGQPLPGLEGGVEGGGSILSGFHVEVGRLHVVGHVAQCRLRCVGRALYRRGGGTAAVHRQGLLVVPEAAADVHLHLLPLVLALLFLRGLVALGVHLVPSGTVEARHLHAIDTGRQFGQLLIVMDVAPVAFSVAEGLEARCVAAPSLVVVVVVRGIGDVGRIVSGMVHADVRRLEVNHQLGQLFQCRLQLLGGARRVAVHRLDGSHVDAGILGQSLFKGSPQGDGRLVLLLGSHEGGIVGGREDNPACQIVLRGIVGVQVRVAEVQARVRAVGEDSQESLGVEFALPVLVMVREANLVDVATLGHEREALVGLGSRIGLAVHPDVAQSAHEHAAHLVGHAALLDEVGDEVRHAVPHDIVVLQSVNPDFVAVQRVHAGSRSPVVAPGQEAFCVHVVEVDLCASRQRLCRRGGRFRPLGMGGEAHDQQCHCQEQFFHGLLVL